MKALGWKDEYALGIPAIDLQHQRIFDCIAGLAAEGVNKPDGASADCSLDQFAVLLKQHFSLEESMMRSFNYPWLEPHVEEHRRFCADVNDLGQTSGESKDGVAPETIKAYQAWQREHVGTSDRHYVEFFLDPRHAGPDKTPLAT